MPEYGEILGSAVNAQYDQQINDLYRQEEMRRRAQQMAEAKAALFANDLNFQNAANQHDAGIIAENAKNQIYKIGQFVRENPDYATNVNKLSELNLMKRQLKENTDLTRGLASDTAYKAYLQDLQEVAKNPQQHDVEAYNDIQRQWDNYLKYGNQNGAESLAKEGKKAFLYTKPKDFVDINERWKNIGGGFKDVVPSPIKGGRNAYEEVARPESLQRVAAQEYEQNKRQYDLIAAKEGVNPIEYIKTGINAHIPKKRDFGDYGLSDALYLANYKKRLDGLDRDVSSGQSAYQQAFVNVNEGVVNPTFLEQTYGSKPNHLIYDNKGNQQFDNTGNRVYYTGVHKWIERKDKSGRPVKQKVVETYTYLTPEQAKEKGIYDDGKYNPFVGEEIAPEWNKQAEVVTVAYGEGGEPVKAIKVKAYLPVEINEAAAGAFDNEVHIAKSKLMANQPNENQSGQSQIGSIITDKKTGKSYKVVEGGYEPLN